MTPNEYQQWAMSCWMPNQDVAIELQIVHALLGLTTETGEVADLFKKPWFTPHRVVTEPGEWKEELIKEIGDILYYATVLAGIENIELSHILEVNKAKIDERMKQNGTSSRT